MPRRRVTQAHGVLHAAPRGTLEKARATDGTPADHVARPSRDPVPQSVHRSACRFAHTSRIGRIGDDAQFFFEDLIGLPQICISQIWTQQHLVMRLRRGRVLVERLRGRERDGRGGTRSLAVGKCTDVRHEVVLELIMRRRCVPVGGRRSASARGRQLRSRQFGFWQTRRA